MVTEEGSVEFIPIVERVEERGREEEEQQRKLEDEKLKRLERSAKNKILRKERRLKKKEEELAREAEGEVVHEKREMGEPLPPTKEVGGEGVVAHNQPQQVNRKKAKVAGFKSSKLASKLRLQPESLQPTFYHPVQQTKRERLERVTNSNIAYLSTSSPLTMITEGGSGSRKKPRTDSIETQSDNGGALLVGPHFPREAAWLEPELGVAYSNPPIVIDLTSTETTEETLPIIIDLTSTEATEETLPILIDTAEGLPGVSNVTELSQEPLLVPTINPNEYRSNLLTPQEISGEDFTPLRYNEEPLPELIPELQPWFDPSCYSVTLTPAQRLQKEMEALVDYLSPKKVEIELRQWVFDQVSNTVKALWPTATLDMFGSFKTGLYIPSSDIDVVILIPELDTSEVIPRLTSLRRKLSKTLKLTKAIVRKNAKVPIINLVESITGLEVDININAFGGIESCELITQFITEFPAIRPLNMVLKLFLELNNLNKVYTGGLSSYALSLLVANFLQVHPLVKTGQLDPMRNLGLLLVEFLELYGVTFNYHLNGITLKNGGKYFLRSDPKSNPRSNPQTDSNYSLELLDPRGESNSVAQGSRNFSDVKNAFRGALKDLNTTIRHYCRASSAGYPCPLLGAMVHTPPATLAFRAHLHDAYRRLFTT